MHDLCSAPRTHFAILCEGDDLVLRPSVALDGSTADEFRVRLGMLARLVGDGSVILDLTDTPRVDRSVAHLLDRMARGFRSRQVEVLVRDPFLRL